MHNTFRAEGTHAICTFVECASHVGYDAKYLESIMQSALSQHQDINVLKIVSHSFGENQGCTVVALLAESHVSLHTYPESRTIFFDLFTCGDFSGHWKVVTSLSTSLQGKIKNYNLINRE
jgi:spermidine synthase